MKIVKVDLKTRSYDIHIGPDLLIESGAYIAPLLRRARVAVVTDSNVAELHLAALRTGLSAANIEMVALTLPAGERTKNWQVLGQTVEWLLDQKIERNDIVIALGGGVIGDLVGFAAAILRRGVQFVQLSPTQTPNDNESYYCSHGRTHNDDHTSATYNRKREGHIDTAKLNNRQGGSTRWIN